MMISKRRQRRQQDRSNIVDLANSKEDHEELGRGYTSLASPTVNNSGNHVSKTVQRAKSTWYYYNTTSSFRNRRKRQIF